VTLKDSGVAGNGGALVSLKSADPGSAKDVPEVAVQPLVFEPKAGTVDAGVADAGRGAREPLGR